MWEEDRGIAGIGYEGDSIEAFVNKLAAWDVKVVFDVRLNPLSRKRGFSKNGLRSALEAATIRYMHMPELGNPKDNRDGYGERGSEAGDAARHAFRRRLEDAPAQEALDQIVEQAARKRVIVMCFEGDTLHCHREQVIDEVERRLGALVEA